METDLNDEDLEVLAELKLDSLWPPKELSDAGMEHVGRIKSLEFLQPADTKITDKGIDYLKNLERLEVVSLRRTTVTPQAVEGLKNARPNLHVAYP